MWPIDSLLQEHRLIERMVALVRWKARELVRGGQVELAFIDEAVLFFRHYADRCHHGKEEGILFDALGSLELPSELNRTMGELVWEHRQLRGMVDRLEAAREQHQAQPHRARGEMSAALAELVDLYPRHIQKEDQRFFYPVMNLLDRPAREAMLERFHRFDRELVHELFRERLARWEGGR